MLILDTTDLVKGGKGTIKLPNTDIHGNLVEVVVGPKQFIAVNLTKESMAFIVGGIYNSKDEKVCDIPQLVIKERDNGVRPGQDITLKFLDGMEGNQIDSIRDGESAVLEIDCTRITEFVDGAAEAMVTITQTPINAEQITLVPGEKHTFDFTFVDDGKLESIMGILTNPMGTPVSDPATINIDRTVPATPYLSDADDLGTTGYHAADLITPVATVVRGDELHFVIDTSKLAGERLVNISSKGFNHAETDVLLSPDSNHHFPVKLANGDNQTTELTVYLTGESDTDATPFKKEYVIEVLERDILPTDILKVTYHEVESNGEFGKQLSDIERNHSGTIGMLVDTTAIPVPVVTDIAYNNTDQRPERVTLYPGHHYRSLYEPRSPIPIEITSIGGHFMHPVTGERTVSPDQLRVREAEDIIAKINFNLVDENGNPDFTMYMSDSAFVEIKATGVSTDVQIVIHQIAGDGSGNTHYTHVDVKAGETTIVEVDVPDFCKAYPFKGMITAANKVPGQDTLKTLEKIREIPTHSLARRMPLNFENSGLLDQDEVELITPETMDMPLSKNMLIRLDHTRAVHPWKYQMSVKGCDGVLLDVNGDIDKPGREDEISIGNARPQLHYILKQYNDITPVFIDPETKTEMEELGTAKFIPTVPVAKEAIKVEHFYGSPEYVNGAFVDTPYESGMVCSGILQLRTKITNTSDEHVLVRFNCDEDLLTIGNFKTPSFVSHAIAPGGELVVYIYDTENMPDLKPFDATWFMEQEGQGNTWIPHTETPFVWTALRPTNNRHELSLGVFRNEGDMSVTSTISKLDKPEVELKWKSGSEAVASFIAKNTTLNNEWVLIPDREAGSKRVSFSLDYKVKVGDKIVIRVPTEDSSKTYTLDVVETPEVDPNAVVRIRFVTGPDDALVDVTEIARGEPVRVLLEVEPVASQPYVVEIASAWTMHEDMDGGHSFMGTKGFREFSKVTYGPDQTQVAVSLYTEQKHFVNAVLTII